MKKMTKILSLALALALVLGMTAFAGTPTEIILLDDFSSYADAAAFKAARTTSTWAGTLVSSTSSTAVTFNTELAGLRTEDLKGTPAYNRFVANPGRIAYYADVNGQAMVGDVGKEAWKNGTAGSTIIGLALDEPWVVTEHPGKALVFTTTMNQFDVGTAEDTIDPATGKLIAGYRAAWSNLNAFGQQLTLNAENTEGDWAGYAVDEEGKPVLKDVGMYQFLGTSTPAKKDTVAGDPFSFISYANAGTIDQRADRKFQIGKNYNISVVFIPVTGTGDYILDWTVSNGAPEGRSLRATTLADFRFSYANDSGARNIYGVSSFMANTSSYHDNRWGSMMFYELSVDPADFYIDAEKTVTENITIDDAMQVVFSQPVSSGLDRSRSSSRTQFYTDEEMVVTAGEEVLTLGEDYTVEFGQKVEGNAVYGTVTVKPVKEWAYGTDYTVTFPTETHNILGSRLPTEAQHEVVFTTEKAPTLDFTLTAYEGLNANGAAVTADSMAGKTVYFTANATNVTGRAIGATIVIGVYDAEGNLVKYAAREKAFADSEVKGFSASFNIEEGQTVKAFAKNANGEGTIQ